MSTLTKTQALGGSAVILGVIAAICVLGWHGTLSGGVVGTLLTAIVTIGGTALVGHAATNAGAKAARNTSTTVVHTVEPPPAPAEPAA